MPIANDSPFPQPLCYCLWSDPASAAFAPQLAQILYLHSRRGPVAAESDTATISLPLVEGSRGTRTVALAELTDCTPLTAADALELTGLNTRHAAFTRGSGPALTKKARARHAALSDRQGNAALLTTQLERLEFHRRQLGRAA